ncbi:MAG: site-2 protease family protein [Defluviitaleaceae bacterium]|nr:site-2 protease family protein [Defluviitaleaceae bacterium]
MTIVITILMVAASLLIHEWAHVFVIKFMGAKVEKVGFFPLGMMAKARRLETLNAWERYAVFVAGPAANIAIALWAFAVSHISYVGVGFLDDLAFYSAVLGIFNLLPALPMDGGRILHQFLGNRIGILRANRFMLRLGIVVSYTFILFGIVQAILFPFNISLLLAGFFIRKKHKTLPSELEAAFHLAIDGKNHINRARTLPIKKIKISPDTNIKQAMERLTGDYFINFYIDDNKQPLREQTLINHVFKHGIAGTVGGIIVDVLVKSEESL